MNQPSRLRLAGVVALFLLSFLLPAKLALPYGRLDWARFSAGYYDPPEYNLLINAGGPQVVDSQGAVWLADQPFAPGGWGYVGAGAHVNTTTQPIGHTNDPTLFQTQRANMTEYRVTLPRGRYRVFLGFAELQFPNRGQRKFNVAVEGQSWLSAYDIVKERGFLEAQDEHDDFFVLDNQLNVQFSSVVQEPVVNTVQVRMRSPGCGDDVNCDGAVTVLDVQGAANNWGRTSSGFMVPAGDRNLDGQVDVVDVQGVAAAWGGV